MMIRAYTTWLLGATAVVALAGCNQGTPGGPGADDADSTDSTYTTPVDSPTVTVPGDTPMTTESRVESATDNVVDRSLDAVDNTQRAIVGPTENTFLIDVPMMATSLKQGESKAVAIGLNRGTNMDQDVTLSFSNLPAGVTINPESPVIMHGDKQANVMVTAAPDAALGDFTIQVNGRPTIGQDASHELSIKIESAQG